MKASHYSSPGGGGGDRSILVLLRQIDLITPIRLCNILTTPLPIPPHPSPHPIHTHKAMSMTQNSLHFYVFLLEAKNFRLEDYQNNYD